MERDQTRPSGGERGARPSGGERGARPSGGERTIDEERLHRKQRLAAAFRVFARNGFDEGIAGHITARDPERLDHFWVNPFGRNFALMRVSDLILVNHDGDVVEGTRSVNPAAFAIHSQVHAARPDVVAAAHSHSVHGKAWSTLGRLLDPITQDGCAFYDDHGLYDEYHGIVFDLDEGKRIAHAIGDGKGAILVNHGLITVGRSVEEAAFWFLAMDRACQVQLLAEAVGTPRPIDPDQAARTAELVGSPASGRGAFKSLYELIVRDEPDLLD